MTTPFKFKQFTVHHDRCSMKVGTDAVLLGAWVNIVNTENILEVGAGSGVISLMLAQRTSGEAKIEAIEIEKENAKQAQENVAGSPWPEKIKVRHQSLQNFVASETYDLIVSNPPYFINSQLPPSRKRSQARHIGSLSYSELISQSLNLLSSSGRLAVVLPFEEGKKFQSLAHINELHTIRQLSFFSRKGKPQERWLFEFSFKPNEIITESLTLHNKGEDWSDEYKKLTKEFYLKL
ncbi:MAG: methyltransferase [Bacteroidia bacterium]|nr:methyltransferase [Bacteroidia bacterium]